MKALITAGCDVGASHIKIAMTRTQKDKEKVLITVQESIRRRDPREVIAALYAHALKETGLTQNDVHYVASTGEGELVDFRQGHFFGMTTHARGALFLIPEARAVVDLGALHARAIKMNHQARVLSYRMTSQCASGSGQFLENIARYLGVALDEIGALSQQAHQAEKISGICSVLAETDVINMVSRGIKTENILRGIHESMAARFVKLLRISKATGVVAVTGGLAADTGMIAALQDAITNAQLDMHPVAHPLSPFAGAIGAGLWGAFRHRKRNGG